IHSISFSTCSEDSVIKCLREFLILFANMSLSQSANILECSTPTQYFLISTSDKSASCIYTSYLVCWIDPCSVCCARHGLMQVPKIGSKNWLHCLPLGFD